MSAVPARVNRGGVASRIVLAEPLTVGRAQQLTGVSREALECWRPRPGEAFTVMDGCGRQMRARLLALSASSAILLPFEPLERAMESPLRLEVYQALPQRERFELILEKLTELGVARLIPFESQRSITQQQRDAGQRKSHRWPEVLLKAARQCRRALIPELSPTLAWNQALVEALAAPLCLVLDAGSAAMSLPAALARENSSHLALMVGPEGGFSDEEIAQLRDRGALSVTLGPRILRTETAAIAAVSAIQLLKGDLN